MSNVHAVALVSQALVLLLQDAVNAVPGSTKVACGHPRDIPSANKDARVNVFLYQVAPNAAWRNTEVSVRPKGTTFPKGQSPVARVPIVPINLYYMISFYGDESTFVPHRMLSAALPALHTATLNFPQFLQKAASTLDLREHDETYYDDTYPPKPTDKHPRSLTLKEQEVLETTIGGLEQIKLNPVQLNLEELSKLWSVFFQVPYTLSIAYEASVILLTAGEPEWKRVATQATLNRPDRAEDTAARVRDPAYDSKRDFDPWRRGPHPSDDEALGGPPPEATP